MARLAAKTLRTDQLSALPNYPASNTDHAFSKTSSRLGIILGLLAVIILCFFLAFTYESILLAIIFVLGCWPIAIYLGLLLFIFVISLFIVTERDKDQLDR